MTTKKITSEDRKWTLDNLGQAMKDLDNDCPEYDPSAIMHIKAALTHLGCVADGKVNL